MSLSFGMLANLEFLQTIASKLSVSISPAVIHNFEKYHMLKKIHYLSSIEDIEADYLEFGVYTGSSFCHSLRVYNGLRRQDSKKKPFAFLVLILFLALVNWMKAICIFSIATLSSTRV